MNENDYRLKVLHELEHLNRTLDKLLKARYPRENHDPPVNNEQNTAKENANDGDATSLIAEFWPRPNTPAKSKHKPYEAAYWQNHPLAWWKERLEVAAFFFAIGYAIITFMQWHDANANFRNDETPYIAVKVSEPTFVDGQPAVIPFDYSNVGKTPALAIKFCMFTMYGVDVSRQLHKISLETCGKEGLDIHNGGSVLPPNASAPTQKIRFINSTYHDTDRALLNSQNDVLAIQGIVQYEDKFNRTWEMGWCFHRLKEGNMGDCSQFSYITQIH